jgi:hypothetical protein
MEVLRWLLIPLAATVLAVLWVTWRSRDRKPADAEQGMEDMARFRQAMEKPLPPLHRTRAQYDEPIDPTTGAGSRP